MATYNLQTAFIKFAKETLPDGATANTSIKFSLGSLWNQTLYYKISIVNQGLQTWTFDDGTTEKTGSLSAMTNSVIGLSFQTPNIPSETMKDQLQLKVSYYKNSDYTGLISEDTINLDIYMLIQQSDGTWGSPSNNLDEDTVVFDVLDDDASNYNPWDFTLQKGRAKVHVDHGDHTYSGYVAGILHNYAFNYFTTGWCSGWQGIQLYFRDTTGKNIDGKIISVVHYETGPGTRRYEIWHGNQHAGLDYDPGDGVWRKIIFPLPSGFWVKYYTNTTCKTASTYIDFIGIFNPF